MAISRRRFVGGLGALAVYAREPGSLGALAGQTPPRPVATHTLRIEPVTLEIARGVHIQTLSYNGQVPGPTLRLREGEPVHIDVHNGSAQEDIVHWHGLRTDARNDGAMEEGSPTIGAGETLRYDLRPEPAGTRWYHTHAMAGDDLGKGQYTGQFGFLLVEPKQDPARYDREFLLAVHHWDPYFAPMNMAVRDRSEQQASSNGADVAYRHATVNAHCLGAGEPLRVKGGERVLLRVLNASATDACTLALPGHRFRVMAMDGNPVPSPQTVDTLFLAAAERIDAVVEMNRPGVWVLGSVLAHERRMGLGVVVEYAGATGAPVWRDPPASPDGGALARHWDYSAFARSNPAATPDEAILLTFKDIGTQGGSRFDTWTINDQSWPKVDPIEFLQGRRYRLFFQNHSADHHPMHLHRHSFEVVRAGGKDMSGLMKDVVNVPPLSTVAVDVVADNPGDSLLHCHMQLHMDFGFMTTVKYRA